MFGCHNCQHKGVSFPSYEESPCSSCAAIRNPLPLSRHPADAATFSSLNVMHPAYEGSAEDGNFIDSALSALGQCVRTLVSLKDSHPETFKFVIAKMDKPSLSYSELASIFNCKKQNVLYHFRKAVNLCPELSVALIVDTRFSGGRPSALKKAAASKTASMQHS